MQEVVDINIYDDCITDDMLNDLFHLIDSKGFQYGWQSNKNVMFSHWHLGFSEKGTRVNRESILDELPLPIKAIWEKIQPLALKDNANLIRAYCNAHTYGTEGYIHRDSDFADDRTAIIYLNKFWKANWAGETVLLEDDEIIKAVMPKWKRLLVFPSSIKHVARSVSRFCPEVRTVLVFKASKSASKIEEQ